MYRIQPAQTASIRSDHLRVYETEIDVKPEFTDLRFELDVIGNIRAWIDSVSLAEVGQ